MSFYHRYSYSDYEDAYCSGRYSDCKNIGIFLLSLLKDDRSKWLCERLKDFTYDSMHPHAAADLLGAVKVWLMVNANNF